MTISFPLNGKPQSSRIRKTSDPAGATPSTRIYVTEFDPAEAPPSPESKIAPIPPLPNKELHPNKKLKNLTALPQSNGNDSSLQFEMDGTEGSNPESVDGSIEYGLNLRQPSENGTGGVSTGDGGDTPPDFELVKLRVDLKSLPEGPGMDEFMEAPPVDGFGAALLSGYGWKEGRGIGRNAKEDVTVAEVKRKIGRGGIGFTDELPDNNPRADGGENENIGGRKKVEGQNENKTLGLGKVVRIICGREVGMKGKINELKSGGDLLVLRIAESDEKVEVRSKDVAEVGSFDEERCLRKLKGKAIDPDKCRKDRTLSSTRRVEGKSGFSQRVNWLRSRIRVKIISQELKGGRLFLNKGVVVDVVGPGICDISIDGSSEVVQRVDQQLLETALPKRGGAVLVLYGRHEGVYGSLLERDLENETGVVRDADTHELLNVKLDQIAEYCGDLRDIGY